MKHIVATALRNTKAFLGIRPSRLLAALLFAAILCHGAAPAQALLILDNMVFIGPKAGAAVFKIKNTGDDPEAYRLDWTQLRMEPTGGKETIMPGEIVPGLMPADPYMYVAPRRLMLKPNQVQHVRFMVRRVQDMPAGEYRAYIVFGPEEVPTPFNPAAQGQAQPGARNAGAQMSLLTGYRIPVFFLNGDTTLNVSATNVGIGSREGRPTINFTFNREGNRSALGSLDVNCLVNGVPLTMASGEIRVFTELASRDYYYYLNDKPPGCTTLNVDYTPHSLDPDYNGQAIRLAEVPLP